MSKVVSPPLENNPEIPPSSREEGLRLLHGLATNLATSLQTPQEAWLPWVPHEQRSLASYSPWDLKELDATEWLSHTHTHTHTYTHTHVRYLSILESTSLQVFLEVEMINQK